MLLNCIKNIAINNIIKNDGNTTANNAVIAPNIPLILYPKNTDVFTANAPGKLCATTNISTNSSLLNHPLFLTTSSSINGIIAYPPPKVNAPILNIDINNSISFFTLPFNSFAYILLLYLSYVLFKFNNSNHYLLINYIIFGNYLSIYITLLLLNLTKLSTI